MSKNKDKPEKWQEKDRRALIGLRKAVDEVVAAQRKKEVPKKQTDHKKR